MEIIVAGNIGNGKTQSRTVYDTDGISPTLCSGMDHGNTIPYIIEIKGVDKVNDNATIAQSRAEQSRAEQSRAEQSRAEQSRGLAIFMVQKVEAMQGKFMMLMHYVLRLQICKEEGGNRISWKHKE